MKAGGQVKTQSEESDVGEKQLAPASAMLTRGWRIKNLGDICLIRTGKKDVNEGNPKGEFPFFTCAAEHTFSDSYSFDAEALLIAGNGDVGKVSYYKGKFEAYQRTYVLSDFSDVLPRFLYHILDGKLKDTVSKQKLGNTMPYIKVGMLKDFQMPIPPFPEQQRIVGILDEAFEGIATAKANAEKNLQNARALFDSHLHAVFTQRGDGWGETSIGDICTLKSGTTIPTDIEKSSGDIPYVKVAEMTMPENMDGITTSIRFINNADIKPSWLIPAGAVIFPKRGGAILTNKKRLALVDICADLNLMSVIPSERLAPEFLYFYFLTIDMRKLGTGSSIPQINNYDIAPLLICFPKSKEKQKEIIQNLLSIEMECRKLAVLYQQKLAALDELKKSLLHQAFSGQL